MLFNSIDFLVFYFSIAVVYPFVLRRCRVRNLLLLVASYVFYGWWDARFLSLLLISTVVDYWIAAAIGRTVEIHRRRWFLAISIAVNLGILGYFKYANFFIDSASQALKTFGSEPDFPTLSIILPLGISFYTFQTLSYTIDVYRRQLEPAGSLLDFALYVAFFPQLVAGPIERAGSLLPQISSPIVYQRNDFAIGTWLVLFGYFKKVYVADNLGASIDMVFDNATGMTFADVCLAVLAFSFQIYGDFSGYSDIARGIARWLGFRLMVNFRLPYFAKSPSEFWQRWHISLSTWLRDYVYIPLGGNRSGELATMRNLMLTMLLGGLWHGAALKFVAWGGFHGVLLILQRRGVRFGWLMMFLLTQIGWLIFRAPSLSTAAAMLVESPWAWTGHSTRLLLKLGLYAGPLVLIDVWMNRSNDLLAPLKLSLLLQTALYGLMLAAIVVLGFSGAAEFIYFQF